MNGKCSDECAGCAWREECRKTLPDAPGLHCLDYVEEEAVAGLPDGARGPGDRRPPSS